ncbi:MAG: 4Fe-4S dicluster domain-containing protein [Thermoplasmatales archaeon]|nr:4Fe-4S dicluster domain-containing protein [Thermoplasmatales archaeon]
MDTGGIREARGISGCLVCGSCTRVCPSARHGGFVPDEFIGAVDEGREAVGIWDCLQCRRCSHACPAGIDVAATVQDVRRLYAAAGNAPAKFLRAAETARETGASVARSPRIAKQRADLGLPVSAREGSG